VVPGQCCLWMQGEVWMRLWLSGRGWASHCSTRSAMLLDGIASVEGLKMAIACGPKTARIGQSIRFTVCSRALRHRTHQISISEGTKIFRSSLDALQKSQG
jgi:hypothetical protein